MVEEDLVLVGSSGLVIYEQDGTRGKLFLSHFLLNSAGWGAKVGMGGRGSWGEGGRGECENLSSKVNVTKFWTFSQKTLFTRGSPSCCSLLV